MKKRVVIVGGGYGGIRVMQRLAVHDDFEITLIDRQPYHYLQTEAYALIAQRTSLIEVTVDLPALCQSYVNVSFVKAEALTADFAAKTVGTSQGDFPYDYLVFAMGSRTFFPATVPGLHDYSHGVKSLPRAFEFRQQFEQELFMRMCSEEDRECRNFSVVIAGAGLSGVEIAAEMADFTREFMRRNRMMCDGIEIHLIASHDDVLEGMDPYLMQNARKRLEQLGVVISFRSRVAEVQPHSVRLDNGREVPFDFMIFAGGIIASTMTQQLGLQCNKKGQIVVEPTLALPGYDTVFAVGDVAELHGPDGKVLPATANGAEKSAEATARNILLHRRGRPLQRADIRLEGIMVALGRYNAAVVLFDRIRFSGFLGFLLKKAITFRYKFLLDRNAFKAYRRLKR